MIGSSVYPDPKPDELEAAHPGQAEVGRDSFADPVAWRRILNARHHGDHPYPDSVRIATEGAPWG